MSINPQSSRTIVLCGSVCFLAHRVHYLCTHCSTAVNYLATESFVIVIGLDFSQAFDAVMHNALLAKVALVEFCTGRKHCVSFQGLTSQVHWATQ